MSAEISINSYLSDLDSSNRDNSDSEVTLTRKVDKNIFVQTTITSYDREDLKDDTLWEQFRENFVDWIENDFKEEILNIRLRRLRNALRKRDVWILKDSRVTIASSLIRILEEEHLTFWIEEEIVNSAEKFQSDVIDHLRKIDFERNLIDYSWQTAQSRSESQKSESARQSSLRERSTQSSIRERSTQSIQSLNKEKLSIRKRFSVSQSIRQRSFELIRQRSSSSQSIRHRSSSSQSIRHRSSSSIFESLNRQQSFSIELQDVRSVDQFIRWDSSIKSFLLKKSRRSISLRSFIELSLRSIFASLI